MWKVMTTCVIIHNMIVQEERDDGIYDGNWKFEGELVETHMLGSIRRIVWVASWRCPHAPLEVIIFLYHH
jgi:hypothetical protein